MKYTRHIFIPAEEFDTYEYYLKNGLHIDGCGRDEVPYIHSAIFPNDIIMEIKVCNADTDEGGAFIDPVLFQDNKKWCQEVACGDVTDSLDDTWILEYNGDEYETISKRSQVQ